MQYIYDAFTPKGGMLLAHVSFFAGMFSQLQWAHVRLVKIAEWKSRIHFLTKVLHIVIIVYALES